MLVTVVVVVLVLCGVALTAAKASSLSLRGKDWDPRKPQEEEATFGLFLYILMGIWGTSPKIRKRSKKDVSTILER